MIAAPPTTINFSGNEIRYVEIEMETSAMKSAAEFRGTVDFGIITIRSDEYKALLAHFPDRDSVDGRKI